MVRARSATTTRDHIDERTYVRLVAAADAAAAVVGAGIIGCDLAQIRAARDALRAMLKDDGPPPDAPFDGLEVLRPAADYKNRHDSIMLTLNATVEAFEALGSSASCL